MSVRIERLLKAESMGRGAVGLEVSQTIHRLRHGRAVSGGNPPEGDVEALEPLEPLPPLPHDRGMRASEYVLPQQFEIGPRLTC